MPWDKILLAAAAGGAVLFIWNALVWMALQYHNRDYRKLPDSQAVADAVTKAGATPGMYMVPHYEEFPGGFKDPALAARFEKGPNFTIVMRPAGPCMQGTVFLWGYALNFAQGLAAAVVFHFAREHLSDLPRTLAFFAAFGAFAHGAPMIAQSIWMGFPWPNTWKTLFDGLVGYALMSLVLRAIL